jgi:phosphotransferase system HPr (HPr) family protein
MQARELVIKSEDGLRASKAIKFTQLAGKFGSQVFIEKNSRKINAKSIMGILSLSVKQGDRIYLFTQGKDEEEAIAALEKLIDSQS